MVVEELFKASWAEKRPAYSLFLGVFFTLLSFLTSFLLFRDTPNFIGISTILFIVILVVPTINKLFDIEEKIEVKENLNFFRKHEHIIDFFVYFFIGVFLVLFLIALLKPNMVFSQQQLYSLKSTVISDGRRLPPPPLEARDSEQIAKLFKNNLYVMGIAFVLSLFYGAGALFLITLNASIFASAIAGAVSGTFAKIGLVSGALYAVCNLGIIFLHMIPEVSGYLLAAIAGGVLSHAFIREKIGSKNFKIVLKDAFILLFISAIVLIIAAVTENEISRKLLISDSCSKSAWIIAALLSLIIFIIVVFEILRIKKVFHKRYNRNYNRKL